MIALFITIGLLAILIAAFMNQPQFGKLPTGERLERIQKAGNYKNGSFQNESYTPMLTEGENYWTLSMDYFFGTKPKRKPSHALPSVKTDLLHADSDENFLVWFGHSSYYMQVDGKRILVDPVLSGSASPLPLGLKAFKGTDIYSTDDIPIIDFLFISHDHWDHLDYATIKKLQPKVNKVICGLGVGAHLEHWGYNSNKIVECNWHETVQLEENFVVHTIPARHFSGRGLARNKSLWLSFVWLSPTLSIFIGGDSGFDDHFEKVGNQFGPFDLAVLENGQYDKKWRYIHLMPDQVIPAAQLLKAKKLLPVHSSKFMLGNHAWNEPLELISQQDTTPDLQILTPMIGEKVDINSSEQVFEKWWTNIS
ncbi:MAG TPA: MBL fold metallo-hydrolase [Phnomibacter sp.]|nr:MBL fold metallo-hydrolase [Phnomibacter sp.]